MAIGRDPLGLTTPGSGDRGRTGAAAALPDVSQSVVRRLRSHFQAEVHRHGNTAGSAGAVAAGYVAAGWSIMLAAGLCASVVTYPHLTFLNMLMAAGALVSAFAFLDMRRGGRPGVTIAALPLAGLALLPVAAGPSLAGTPGLTLASLGIAIMAMAAFAMVSAVARRHAASLLKQADSELHRHDEERRAAMDAARIALWEVPELPARTLIASESFTSLTGYTAAEFSEFFSRLEEIIHPDDLPRMREDLDGAARRLGRTRTEFRLKTRMLGYRWFIAKARFARTPSGCVKVTGSMQDVSFAKATEDSLRASRDSAQRADKAKTDFMAVMSHEIRTPMNAIMVSVELLRRRQRDPEAAVLLRTIDEAGNGLLAIVNDMLDIARIEAGRVDLRLADSDIAGLVERTADLWRPQAAARGLDLSVSTGALQDIRLAVDEARIRQVVGNLLSNAIKFTPAGQVSVEALVEAGAEGRMRVRIDVRDTGPGIPAEAAERLFSPFEQVEPGAGQSGAGLGLSICRSLARLMDGDVVLAGTHPGGTCFSFTFSASPAAQPALSSEGDPADDVSWRGARVLCVDDNPTNRRLLALLLAEFGVETHHAASGEEALSMCAVRPYDLILMDIMMPGLDGFETFSRLRGSGPSPNQRTPVIALTARVSRDDLDAYEQAGFDGAAQKPLDVRELAAALERHLGPGRRLKVS